MCLTTVATREEAQALAKKLLAERHAACVQIEGPIESHYEWKGEAHCDQETRVVIKSAIRSETLIESIRAIHPYEKPQIVVFQCSDVDAGYANWVRNTN